MSKKENETKEPAFMPVEEPETTKEPQQVAINKSLTAEEAAIASRIMSESDEWQTLTEGDVEQFSLADDPMPFPEPVRELVERKLFAFRWVARTIDRIDQVRNKPVPFRWYLVNRTSSPGSAPEFRRYFDPNTGGIHSLDQVLVFKPWWMFDMQQRMKRELADIQDNTGALERKDGIEPQKGVRAHTGEAYRIGNRDEVQFDEEIENPGHMAGELGDLVVNE